MVSDTMKYFMLPDSPVPPACFVAAAALFLVVKCLQKLCGEREMW